MLHRANRLACSLLALLVAPQALAEVPPFPGWQLVWQDEFEGPSIDEAKWEVLTRQNSFNEELQFYVPQQASIADGRLRITATDERKADKRYRSARLESWDEWSHGRFEARIDLPTTKGMWPAFWLLPRTVKWPLGGEIDIMENRGSQPNLTSSAYHWNDVPDTSNFLLDEYTASRADGSPEDFHAGMHDYAVEWERGVLRFYVDGNRHFTLTDADAPILETAKCVVLNLAVGGTFDGDPDDTTHFPQQMDIEYVRVWQRENGFVGLVNGGFDEDRGSLNDWQAFGDADGNIRVTDNGVTGEHAAVLRATAAAPRFAGILQNVAIRGGETLRARLEGHVAASDAFAPDNTVAMKVEFYSRAGALYGSADFLGERAIDIADAATATGAWRHCEFLVDAPVNAVEARLTLILIKNSGSAGAISLDGVALTTVDFLAGDYNFDGRVDAADFTVWRETEGSATNLAADGNRDGVVDEADRSVWELASGA